MNVVQSGGQYQIYGESLKTYNELPIKSYEVGFHKMMGFFLTERADLEVKEEKIYGNHRKKVCKALNAFNSSNRNFGIILSGQKGIGKSLFARLLAVEAIANGLPVITVSSYIPGIANFISSIEQEVVVIFDEFEKTFGKIEDKPDPQEEMLSLFDGLDGGKKLFVITCNEIKKLNSYLLDRPGRFHYHFKITNPNDEEINEYLKDKLSEVYWNNIPRVINFSRMVDITYDALRAIAFELNHGYSIEETFADLNITGVSENRFDIKVLMDNGVTYSATSQYINLCINDELTTWVRGYIGGRKADNLMLLYNPSEIEFKDGNLTIPLDKIQILRDTDDDYELSKEEIAELDRKHEQRKVVSIVFEKINTYLKNEKFLA